MKKKAFALLLSCILVSICASSQTIKDNIDKLAKDKSTRDKADKADVLIPKKAIFDSTQIKITPVKVVSKTPVVYTVKKTSLSKHKYKKKRKISSK